MVSAGFSHEKLNDTPDFSMDGTVSIILPCYNVAPYLDECLESLVRQTWEDLEIICVNDGSTDDTPAVLRGWAEKDARIRVIHQENGGAFSARNAGLDAAAGEYIGLWIRMITWIPPCMPGWWKPRSGMVRRWRLADIPPFPKKTAR